VTLRTWPSFFLSDVVRTNLSNLSNGYDAVDAFSATFTVVGPYARCGSHLSIFPYLPYTSDLPHGYDHPLASFYSWLRDLPCLSRVTHGVVRVRLNFTVLWTHCAGRPSRDYPDAVSADSPVRVLAVSPDNPDFAASVHYPDGATSRFLLGVLAERHEPDPRDTLDETTDDDLS